MTADIKNSDLETKAAYFRKILADLNNNNPVDILNVYRLVNSYNTFSPEFFEDSNSYITDISEFIDLRIALSKEIKDFTAEAVKWYLAALASCDIKTETEPDQLEEMPRLIYGFFANATVPMMSAMMRDTDFTKIDMANLPNVTAAFAIVGRMFNSHAFVAHMLANL